MRDDGCAIRDAGYGMRAVGRSKEQTPAGECRVVWVGVWPLGRGACFSVEHSNKWTSACKFRLLAWDFLLVSVPVGDKFVDDNFGYIVSGF